MTAETEAAEMQPAETQREDLQRYGVPYAAHGEQKVIFPHRDMWLQTAVALLQDGWNMCLDVTAVDYLDKKHPALPSDIPAERFEVVATFISYERKERLRARIQVPEADPTIGSLYTIYPGSDYLEREVYDMFGINFEGHPDLSRILMPENWQGHPLRKDYAVGSIPVQFKNSRQDSPKEGA